MVVVAGKLKNPRETANIFSYFSFLWFLPTILKGYKRPLNENDLFDVLDEYRAKQLGDQIEEVWEKEETKANPSLMKAVLRTVGLKSIVLYALGGNVLDFIKISQIVILIRLLENLSSPDTNNQGNIYKYATLLVLCSVFVATTQHLYTFGSKLIGMKVRLALCSILYRKALKLSKRSFGGAVGPLLNMLGNDVSRFDLFAISLNHIFSPPLHICTILTIVYFEVGWTGCVGVGIILIFIPLQVIWGKMLTKYKQRIAHQADQRVHISNEIISGIQVIKMYAWESFFNSLISKIRNIEIKLLRYNYVLTSITGSIYQVIPQLPLLSAILLYIIMGNYINPGYVYALVACYNILKASILSYLPNAILTFADTKVAVKRFETYLWCEEVPLPKVPKEKYISLSPLIDQSTIGVTLSGASAAWGAEENALEDISITISNSKLIAIVGPVGSGKSSLLNVILKELPLVKGKVKVTGSVSYASQEPWLFLGTIRENILFGQPYNEEMYKKVIKMCALERDFSLFSNGDLAIVRERGSNLSGGQKSRINLARAIYKQADIYIIDDPLAAVDVHVAKYIFENCIAGYLKEKCVILVTNQLQLLKSVDYVYILKNGRVIDEGTYPGLQKKRVFKECEEHDQEKSHIDIQPGFDYSDSMEEIEDQEAQQYGKVSLKLYGTYFKGGGGIFARVLLILALLMYHSLVPINNLFISHWSNIDQQLSSEDNRSNETMFTREDYIIFFMGIAGSLALSSVIYAISFFLFFVQCNKSIHQKVISKVINAPMQFFSLNPSGRILNRFARDLGIVDNNIAIAVFDVTNITMQVIQIMIMVIIANAWLSPAVVIVIVSTYMIRMVYLPACVSIKRIEGILRSPIFTYMKGTIEGLATIRASGEQSAMKRTFEGLLDAHTSTWYMYLASTHTFGIAIDTLCALFLAIVTLSFVIPGQDIPASRAGLAITESLVLIETVQWMMRQWNELTTNMTSIERLAEYLDIEQEGLKDNRSLVPHKLWGERGSIEFQRVNLKYGQWSKPVLKNINFRIYQFEKIGIVGRTGAGKSSLSTALFQLAFTEGVILIDGIDISKIPLNILRTKLSIIPQEPVLFTANLRENLDPFEEYDDSYIWQALSEVELMKVITELPNGLGTNISVGGANFSVGQRQLLCLARAILKRTKILIIDEATANVDAETDSLIQKTIRRKFEDCTVLTIAHRLNTIIDSHRVMVLQSGEIKEFDSPLKLLESKGIFYDMIQRTGDTLASNLHRTAQVAYRRNAST